MPRLVDRVWCVPLSYWAALSTTGAARLAREPEQPVSNRRHNVGAFLRPPQQGGCVQSIDRLINRRCEIGGVCRVHPGHHFVDEHGNGCRLLGGEFARHTESEVVKNIDIV